MNRLEDPLCLPLTPTSSYYNFNRSGWHTISIAIGRVFSAILTVQHILFSLVTRVAQAASNQLFIFPLQTPTLPETSSIPPKASNNHFSPYIGTLFDDDIDQQLLKSSKLKHKPSLDDEEELSPDSEIDESPHSPIQEQIKEIEQLNNSGVTSVLEVGEKKTNKFVEERIKENPEINKDRIPVVSPAAPLLLKEKFALKPQVIDVPDNGNCLFYAAAVGLRKKYYNDMLVQEKLNWSIKPDQLAGNLKTAVDLLDPPGKTLRVQAANYLRNHLIDDEIMIALMEGIGSHLEVAEKKINEEVAALPFAKEEVDLLEKELHKQFNNNNAYGINLKRRIKENKELIEKKEQSIQFLQDTLPNEDDLTGYIDITKKDKVYAGIAQALALSKEYNVPVRIINFFGTAYEYPQLFNEQADKTPPPPIITIAHVNGNHFQYIDD